MIELKKFLFLSELVVELLEVLGLSWVFYLNHLYELPLEFPGGLFNMLEWVYGELSHPHLMALRIYVAFESVLVLTLLPAELAEVLQTFGRHNQYIMNNDIAHRVDHLGRKGKEGALVKGG